MSVCRTLGLNLPASPHRRDHQRREGVAALVQPDRLDAVEVPDPLRPIEEPVVGERPAVVAAEDEVEAALEGTSPRVDQLVAEQSGNRDLAAAGVALRRDGPLDRGSYACSTRMTPVATSTSLVRRPRSS